MRQIIFNPMHANRRLYLDAESLAAALGFVQTEHMARWLACY